MDKSREGERGEKSHSGLPPGMDPATAALYANMFGSSGLGGFNPAAAAASGLSGWGGLPHGFPPTSSAAGLASLAAAQQAQQAAALAGLGPAAAWWNLAGLQQMELLSRLQGGLGGSSGGAAAAAAAAAGIGGYAGLHPEHLMNLEILQAQHAAAMAAALSTSKAAAVASTASKVPRSTKNGTGLVSGGAGSKGITSTLSYRGGASTTTTTYSSRTQEHLSSSSRPGLEISRLAASSSSSSTSASSLSSSHHPLYSSSPSSSSSSLSGRPPPYPFGSSSTHSLSHRYSSSGLDSLGTSHHSDNVVGSSPSLSYGIASLIADKHPSSSSSSSSSHSKVHSSSSSSLTASSSSSASNASQAERVAEKLAGNGSVSISKAIRNKELEIIPISPSVKGGGTAHGSVPPHRDKSEPKVSISTVAAAAARLSNGVPGGAAWREESASVSIEPCGPTPSGPPGPPGSGDDAPLNLSMKTAGLKPVKVGEKREHKDALGALGLGRSGLPPLDFPQGLGGGLGPMLTPSLEVLQSLYGAQPGEPRDVLASMQEALQRQLLGADMKRDEKKKRLQMEDVQDRSRHLGRGTSKPKKNTVASLLEQCRAAGIKPSSLPLPPTATTSIVATSASTSPPLHAGPAPQRSGDALSITSTSPIFNSSPSPSPAAQSLPPTLLPGLPLGLSSASSSSYPSSVGSPAPPTPIPTPPVPSLSISTVVSSSSPPSPLPPSDPVTTTATTTTTTVSSTTTTTTTTTTTASSVTTPPSPPPASTPTPTTTTTTIPPPQPASPPSTPASVTASPPPPQSTPTSTTLPVSLPPSLSLSSSVSITSVTPEAAITSTPSKPSVTIHPTTSASETTPEQEFDTMDNSVDIMEVSRTYPHQNGGEKPIKKRHMITSSSVDGRLITTIKAATTGAPDSSELSDSESDDESTSLSSVDDDGLNHLPSPWLKRDTPDSASAYSESPPVKKRKMITDEVSLRVPLMYGWRRETTMRTITQSGVRGEVIYYAPCGKPFRQYPDIMRYLEKNGITEVTRDNFSFSSKIPIGEYVEAGTQVRHNESEVRDKIHQIREQKGYKPLRRNEDGRDALEIEAEAILRRLEAEEEAEKARKDLMSQLEEQHQLRIQKEQERIRKQEELRREKEELRRQREEENRQRLYEQLRKAQEREQEKQKQKILKEQLYLQELNKQREMLYTLELERERRRYHGVLVRAIEGRKRHEERERRREEMKEEKRATRERKREERLQARELNQLMKEVKEDMELTDHTPLPDAPRLQGLRLPPEAFGNILMVFEFLHNFGETLGFDMESLPSIQSLQMALLNDTESEEELLSVLSHLLVCAIEDPGIPSAQRHTTILGQTLNRADITHANISEILRVYLNANAMGEVRIIHGLMGTEKERRENPKKGQEWDARLAEMDAYKMAQWLVVMPFLALNPTQKSEIVAYVCNELLQNKAVVRQIEDSLDRHNGLKTEKWKLDARIRKLRMSVARKRIYNAAMRSMMEHRGEDSNMSSVSSCHGGEHDKADAKKDKDDDKLEDDEEDEENESGNDSDNNLEEIPDEEDDKRLNADDASKTLDILQRQMNQVRQDLFETAQQVRGFNCGQDRYQRTMWVLPHAGGPFLEGLSSCDYTGRGHFPLTIPSATPKVGLTQEEVEERLAAAREEKEEKEKKAKEEQEAKAKVEVKEEAEVKEEKMEVKTEVEVKTEKEEEVKEGEEGDVKPPALPLLQVKKEEELKEEKKEKEDDCDVPDIPKRGERKAEDGSREGSRTPSGQNGIMERKESIGNSLADLYPPMLGSNLNPYLVNGLKETPPPPTNAGEGIDPSLLALGLGLVPGQYLRPEHVAQREKLSFSLMPRIPCDVSSMEALPTGQTPQGTPRGSPREASPCSRYNGPQSPVMGAPQGPGATPGPPSTLASTVNTPLAVSTPKPPTPSTPNTGANTTETSASQEVSGTPDVAATPDPASGTPGNITTDTANTTDVTTTPAPPGTPGRPPGSAPTDGAPGNTPGGIQSLPHKELLERLHQTAEALPVPAEYKTGWWHLGDMEQLKEMIGALNERGVRERELKRFIEKNFSIVKNAISKIDADATNLETDPEEAAKVVYDEFGTPVADEPQHWLPEVALRVDFAILDSVYAMEEKITNASMQSKSWRLTDNGERHMGEFRASCLEPTDEGDSRLNPIHVGRDRLLALEEGIERRYLKPPLGIPVNPKNDQTPDTKEVPKGLLVWREAVAKAETASQLAMCTYMLETAVAWDKSIMKAYCQFCHSGDHEEKLLLCDGCDKGYHTHCFKPPMNNIPDGDWYCYECVNKFSDTSQRHCLVCGGTEGRTLVHCSVCPRAYHTTCITPNLAKVPRNKWVCPACTSKSPRGRRGRAKKVSESNASAPPPDPPPDALDDSQGAVSPAVTKKDRANKKKEQKDLQACKNIVGELEVHEDAWPFLLPVNTRQFPTYKKIIRKPMDLSVIKKKLEENQYKSREEYCEDLRLMFNNCETFNEDDSPVGKAGHNLRSFFETRWNENFPPT